MDLGAVDGAPYLVLPAGFLVPPLSCQHTHITQMVFYLLTGPQGNPQAALMPNCNDETQAELYAGQQYSRPTLFLANSRTLHGFAIFLTPTSLCCWCLCILGQRTVSTSSLLFFDFDLFALYLARTPRSFQFSVNTLPQFLLHGSFYSVLLGILEGGSCISICVLCLQDLTLSQTCKFHVQ